MPFTPIHAVIGGLSIGLSTFWNARLNGKVTGISGTLRSALSLNRQSLAFLAGLSTAGVLLRPLIDAPLTVDIVSALPLTRLVPAGVLVGLGATIGNGCTSGHAVSGLSRLSMRSLLATLTLMTTAVVSAKLSGTAQLYDLDAIDVDLSNIFANAVLPSVRQATRMLATVLISAAVPQLVWKMAKLRRAASGVHADDSHVSTPRCVQEVLQFVLGLSFGSGLIVAGMANPQKVIAFLNVATASWDPTLMFVFVGALPLGILGFRPIVRGVKPKLADTHSLPSRSDVDGKLLTGAALFGAGWGMIGLCPGPAFVYFGVFPQSTGAASFVASMIVGISCAKPVLTCNDAWLK